jgi:cysteine desulfurase
MHMLDLKGICISTGSACDSKNQDVSHVINAIKVPDNYAKGTVRISFGKENTEQDAIDIAEALIKVINL